MKHRYLIHIVILAALLLQSCSPKEDDLKGSDIDTSTPILNETDKWIRTNYTTPYNIDILYKWETGRTDLNRYLHPPLVNKVQPALEAIKTVWIDSYTELGGDNFIKEIAPREIALVGGRNINPGGGTSVLGLAEAGARIVFFNTNTIDFKKRDDLLGFIGTIQHEYVHILNQKIPFDDATYKLITPTNYTGQWFEFSDIESRELGYITAYARSNENEDFAEMVKTILSTNRTNYDNIVNSITSEIAKENIRKKEAIVVSYYRENFNIDLYELQEIVAAKIELLLI